MILMALARNHTDLMHLLRFSKPHLSSTHINNFFASTVASNDLKTSYLLFLYVNEMHTAEPKIWFPKQPLP